MARRSRTNRPVPQWVRMRTNNKIRSVVFYLFLVSAHQVTIPQHTHFILDTTQRESIGAEQSYICRSDVLITMSFVHVEKFFQVVFC